ncbi:MAG: lysine--tRNA ligase [Alphaproteobacteria bacterium]|nr:lysine--tRNA ligase [Alphaproteobacteria bacterium]
METKTQQAASQCRTWAFEEARGILKRLTALHKGKIRVPDKGYVLFETGYGPSGLPHIGTFGEVARTTMVMQAFRELAPEIPAKLVCFSDDMDGLRKVPDNLTPAQQDIIRPYAENRERETDGTPLTAVPDPFGGLHPSYGAHNNARLREFLDHFGFEYDFFSSTDCYRAGTFNEGLRKILSCWEPIRDIVGGILGEDRKQTYSPLFPIIDRFDPAIGKDRKMILHNVALEEILDPEAGIVRFKVLRGPMEGEIIDNHCVLNGGAKAQWRVDWALRWYALDVDYEMAGKDLASAAEIAGKVLQNMGGRRPAGFHYEMFLDEKGEKISKSKGNGLSMEDWLAYAPHESLAYYMFQRPTSAKKLHFDIIPKAVDEYITFIEKLAGQDEAQRLENPAWYIHGGRLPNGQHTPVSFALLLNLVSVANPDSKEALWAYIKRYSPEASPENAPFLDRLAGYAVKYYEDFVQPRKSYRLPDERERRALTDLAARLEALPPGADLDAVQTEVFSAGKEAGYGKEELRGWFQALYQVLLGQDEGPRFGSFAQLYGIPETVALIRAALAGKFAQAA